MGDIKIERRELRSTNTLFKVRGQCCLWEVSCKTCEACGRNLGREIPT